MFWSRLPVGNTRPSRSAPALALSTGVGMVLACGGVDLSAPNAPAVRDSAGVRLVEHRSELSGPAIALELLWEHGHDADDYTFQFVSSGGLQPDGGAVITDFGNREVIAIGPDGSFNGVLAGTGQGPSEVMRPGAVVVPGQDTVWIKDPGNAKLMRFEGGALAATVSTSGDRTLTSGMMPIGVGADGELLMTTSSFRSDFEQPWLDGHLTRFDPTTRLLDTVGAYPMASRTSKTERNPYSPYGVVAAAGRGFVHGRTDVPQLTWRDSNGEVVQFVRWRPRLRYPDAEMWDQFEASLRADLRRVNPGMGDERLQAFLEEQAASHSVDTSKPVPLFGRIRGTPVGAVWLPSFVPGSARPTGYLVVSSDGAAVGVAEFPRPLSILDAGEQMVLGIYADDLDVQGVAVYRYRFNP